MEELTEKLNCIRRRSLLERKCESSHGLRSPVNAPHCPEETETCMQLRFSLNRRFFGPFFSLGHREEAASRSPWRRGEHRDSVVSTATARRQLSEIPVDVLCFDPLCSFCNKHSYSNYPSVSTDQYFLGLCDYFSSRRTIFSFKNDKVDHVLSHVSAHCAGLML